MINLVLSSLPFFFLSFFRIPTGVGKRVQREFLKGGWEEEEDPLGEMESSVSCKTIRGFLDYQL